MNHRTFLDLLAVRDFLSPPEATQLDAHVQECAACRQEAQLYTQQDAGLRALAFPDPPSSVRAGVWQRIEQPRRPFAWLRQPFGLLIASTSLLLVVALVALTIMWFGRPSGGSRSALPAPKIGRAHV